jgi:signal transduction histidine kinase
MTGPRFLLAVALLIRAGGLPAAAPDDRPVPMDESMLSIADVLALPAADLARGIRVRVQGTVTLCDFGAVIQDGRHALWVVGIGLDRDEAGRMLVAGRDGARQPIGLGSRLEVVGVVDRGGFAPRLQADPAGVTLIGTASLPEPVPFDADRVLRGGDNAVRVEIGRDEEVIAQGCEDAGEEWRLMLDMVGQRLRLGINKRLVPERPDHLVDASIRAVVLPAAARNSRGQFLLPQFIIAAADDIEIVKPAPFSPFESPLVPLDALGTYRSSPPSRHRIQTIGTVTCIVPGRAIYLQEGLTGVRVAVMQTDGLAIGDRVRVAGFVDMDRRIAGIVDGIVERTSSGPPPAAARVAPDEIRTILRAASALGQISQPSNYSGVLVTFPATLVERQRSGDDWLFTLTAGSTTFTSRLAKGMAGDPAVLTALEPDTEFEVTGVVELGMTSLAELYESVVNPETESLEVILRSQDDLRVVRRPSWWTPRRLAIALGGLAFGLAAAVGWVVLLRREVARQAEKLAAERQTRREAAVEYQATLRERSRLAANLHDTVLQTVTGIGYQLNVCSGALAQPQGKVEEKLSVAEKMVGHAVQQLRGTVWALRTAAPSNRPLPEALADLAQQVGGGHETAITVRSHGAALPAVADFVAGNLLLIAQEAMLNALRHGAASRIDVDLAFMPADGRVELTVRDDGRGFTIGSQPGPRQGHFGLEGMRERAERLGGTLALESTPGAGTSVRVVVPVAATRAAASPSATT